MKLWQKVKLLDYLAQFYLKCITFELSTLYHAANWSIWNTDICLNIKYTSCDFLKGDYVRNKRGDCTLKTTFKHCKISPQVDSKTDITYANSPRLSPRLSYKSSYLPDTKESA